MVKIIFLAVLKLAASAFWAYGFYCIAKEIDVAVQSGETSGPSGMFDVFLQLGLAGIFQSIGALRGLYAWWGGSMETAITTRHFTLWKNSSGHVVAAEEDHSAPIIGCLMSLVIGGFLVVACSALLSPIMFIINIVSVVLLLTSYDCDSKTPSILGVIISVIIGIACIGGTIYGWNYISNRMDVLEKRREEKRIQQQKEYEKECAEKERLAAEKRAQKKAQQEAERQRREAHRKAENEARRAKMEAERIRRAQLREAEKIQRADREAQRRAENEARRVKMEAERMRRSQLREAEKIQRANREAQRRAVNENKRKRDRFERNMRMRHRYRPKPSENRN